MTHLLIPIKAGNLPTAEEFCNTFKPTGTTWQQNFHQTMIEFAKLHVKVALEAANENVKYEFIPENHNSFGKVIIDKDSIINAYPENMII
jgi:hypothetical protein